MSFLAESETPQRRLERHADYTDLIRSFKDKREKKREKRTENSDQRNIYFWTSRESHEKEPYLGKEAY